MARGLDSDNRPTAPYRTWEPPSLEDLGRRLAGFEVLELIGRGGMGAVYKARDRKLDRIVAVKILPPEAADAPEFAERFTREARALARLNHPNIVAIYDFGEADGWFFFVMEFVDGLNLRQAIRSGAIQPDAALRIVPQICDALQYAHAAGVVHRDIKPENILLDRAGRVKIADFGLAKLVEDAAAAVALTATDRLVGTMTYMAPEQLEGSRVVDHRADIYSLGVVFYEMLTGELPLGRFSAPSHKVQVDVRLDEIVLRALEKEPDRRYQQAGEVRTDVETLASPPAGAPSSPGVDSMGTARGSGPALAPGTAPRFSRKALLGSIWFLSILICVFALGASVSNPLQGARFVGLLKFLGWSLAPFAITAPLGGTVLGLMALNEIRHSGGRIGGLPLAMFDALLVPLAALDALIVFIFGFGTLVIADLFGPDRAFTFRPGPGVEVLGGALGLLLALILDAIIVFLVWRSIRRPLRSA